MSGSPEILTSLHGRKLGLGPNGELIVGGTRVTNGIINGGPFAQAWLHPGSGIRARAI
jgi:hypothetical protein